MLLIVAILLLISTYTYSQNNHTHKLEFLIDKTKNLAGEKPDSSIFYGNLALAQCKDTASLEKKGVILKYIGIAYFTKGEYVKTLDYWNKCLTTYSALKDEKGYANTLSNIGSVYFNQGNDAQALDYYLKALRIAEKLRDSLRIVTLELNIGTVYLNKSITYNKALEYFKKAIKLSILLKDSESTGMLYGNIGELYMKQDSLELALDYLEKSAKTYDSNSTNLPYTLINLGNAYLKKQLPDSAIRYQQKAYDILLKLDSKSDLAIALNALGHSYLKKSDNNTALDFFMKASKYAQETENTYSLNESYKGLYNSYFAKGDYKLAYKYQDSIIISNKNISNISSQKKLGALQFDFDLTNKNNELNILEIDTRIKQEEINKSKLIRNIFLFGLVLACIGLIIFYRQKKKLGIEKSKSDNLLLNILPKSVVEEIKVTGKSKARHHQKASIMFTDFKNFTNVSENLSAEELVKLINEYYVEFDRIIEKYNLEKIKTIGDAYMCAAGITNTEKQQHINIAKAAIEIVKYVNKRKTENPLSFDIRIGIHTGSVISGVVGLKKFAYDIWGDAVNIAARMESSGIIGAINISAVTYNEIKSAIDCDYRGKIEAKNKGKLDMYLIQINQKS